MKKFPRVLIVEDEPAIAELIAVNLRHNGFAPIWAEDGDAAQRELDAVLPDVILLDWMLPGQSGLQLARKWRADARTKPVPILMLTARGDEPDKVAGLDAGADDYITKPFSTQEMLARIRAVLRRTLAVPKSRDAVEARKLKFDRFVLDVQRRELLAADGVSAPLSTAEFQLLTAFLKRPNMVLNRDQLMDLTSGRTPQIFDRSIDNQVSRLRKKIEIDPKVPELIKTVWGGGYIFTADVEEIDA